MKSVLSNRSYKSYRSYLRFLLAKSKSLMKTAQSSKKPRASGTKHVERVRQACLKLPDTTEKLSHGEPTFFVRKRVFAMCSINHHNDGHIAVVIPAAIGVQAALIEQEPEKFYRPPYVGHAGWVGIELPRISDRELAAHIREAWNLIAPEKLRSTLD